MLLGNFATKLRERKLQPFGTAIPQLPQVMWDDAWCCGLSCVLPIDTLAWHQLPNKYDIENNSNCVDTINLNSVLTTGPRSPSIRGNRPGPHVTRTTFSAHPPALRRPDCPWPTSPRVPPRNIAGVPSALGPAAVLPSPAFLL